MNASAPPTTLDAARTSAREPWIELARIGAAALGIATPFVVGCLVGDRPHDVPLEPRYAYVIATAALALLAVLAESGDARVRRLCAGSALVPIAHLGLSGSPPIAAADVALVLTGAIAVLVRGVRRIARGSASRRARIAAITVVLLCAPGPLVTVAWGLVSTTLAPAIIRLFHGHPEIGVGESAVEFPSRDGIVLRGTWAPGEDGAPGLLLVHGLGDSRWRLVPWARALHATGAHVLRIDLRAHGVSDGVAVTYDDREVDDVEAALRWLAARPGVGPLHVLSVSMGGGASLAAVARRTVPVASIVALAPATDYRALVDGRLPPFEPLHGLAAGVVRGVTHGLGHPAPPERSPADAVVRAGPMPILVVHSRSDATIPASLTERLAERAPWIEVAWIDGVRHNDMPAHTLETPVLRERIEQFLARP